MRCLWAALSVAFFAVPSTAWAGNEELVVAGTDVALSGGAVVAHVGSGGALWYNPAGVAQLDERSVGLTGALVTYRVARAPGVLSLQSGEESEGNFSSVDAVPRAVTVVGAPRPDLRFGVGLFFTQTTDRVLQDAVAGSPGAGEPDRIYASNQLRDSVYHAAASVGWRHSKRFRLGGGADAVLFTRRRSQFIAGAYAGGAGGALDRSISESFFGGGLQLKLGLQWQPSEHLHVGWMASTPSVLFFYDETSARAETIASPSGTPVSNLSQVDRVRATFSSVEPALTRVGMAYDDDWGWIEADAVVRFPLRTEFLDLNRGLTTNVHVGGIFNVHDKVKVGAGLFTDFSANRELEEFGDEIIDYYGATFGADVSNRGRIPLIMGREVYFALAFAARYAYGTGELVGLRFPTNLGIPPDPSAVRTAVPITVHDMGFNFAFKVGF